MSLPRGVRVDVAPSQFGDQLELRWSNRSRTPLVLIKRLPEPLGWLRTLPKNTLPIFKLVDNKWYEWTNEGWSHQGTAVSPDELFASHRLRPFEREFKKRPLPKGKGTIVRTFRIPYVTRGKQYYLTGEVAFDVDYDSQALLKSRVHLSAIPTPEQLVYTPPTDWVGAFHNPSAEPVYFVVRAAAGWVGKLPANEVPCYRILGNRVYYSPTPSHPSSRRQRSGWILERSGRSVDLPISWFAERAGVKLHLQRDYYRPRKLTVPAAQLLRIPVRYGGKLRLIRVKVSYSINRAFRGRVRDTTADGAGRR